MKSVEASANLTTRDSPNATMSGRLAVIALIAAVGLVYANSLRAPFLFDDADAVLNNPTIRHLGSLDVLKPPADGSATTGRPIVNLSFAISYYLSGERVWSYHALNGVIHTLAALTLMGLVRSTLLRPRWRETFGQAAPWIAFFTALLWAVHPLQTESVTCVAQRTELLCGLFYLLTLYAFTRGTEVAPSGSGAQKRWLGSSVIFCLLGMGSKEVMVSAPFMVLLYDRTFVSGSFSAAWRTRAGYYCALAATWLFLVALVLTSGGKRGIAAGLGLGVSGWAYLLKQCEALVQYLKLSIWPSPLVLDYGTDVIGSIGEVWWQGLVVLALIAGTAWALRRRPAIGFIGAWFFVILAPSSSFVPLVTQTMAEHRMYLPLAAIIAMVVTATYRRFGFWTWAVAGGVATVFSIITIARNHDYRSGLVIWTDTVNKRPESARAQVNLGAELLHEDRRIEAIARFQRAVQLRPNYVAAHYNLGVALLQESRIPEAITAFEIALKLAPAHPDAHLNLGNALVRARRTAEAVLHYEAALRFHPAADAHYNLAIALIELERYPAAVENLQTALRLNENLPDVYYQLGRVAELTGAFAEAEKQYENALRLKREHIAAHRRLGMIFARGDQLGRAAEHFRAVIRLEPRDADAYANLGNVFLIQGKPREAIPLYEEALSLRPDDARTRENLQLARAALR